MLIDNNKCFACGRDNTEGLKLEFSYPENGDKALTTFTPAAKYQGWEDILHGGIIITLLDEVMAKAAVCKGFQVVTGEITAKLKNPARIAETLRCEGRVDVVKKKVVYASGTVYKEDGTIVAQATAKMFII